MITLDKKIKIRLEYNRNDETQGYVSGKFTVNKSIKEFRVKYSEFEDLVNDGIKTKSIEFQLTDEINKEPEDNIGRGKLN